MWRNAIEQEIDEVSRILEHWQNKMNEPNSQSQYDIERGPDIIKECNEELKVLKTWPIPKIRIKELNDNFRNPYLVKVSAQVNLLDANATLNAQQEQIQNILRKVTKDFNLTGKQFYIWLAQKLGSFKKASKWLLKHGISGIQDKEGATIWDSSKIEIRNLDNLSSTIPTTQLNEARPIHKDIELSLEYLAHATPQEQIAAVRRRYEGTPLWMKAPNGQPTNLTEQQWLAVRTPNFIRWFGDWINDPEHASKAVDENGEPRVFYRGITIDIDKLPPILKGGHERNIGGFYSSSIKIANTYTGKDNSSIHSERIYEVFLNIRNPYIFNAQRQSWNNLYAYSVNDSGTGETIIFNNASEANQYVIEHRLDPQKVQDFKYLERTLGAIQNLDEDDKIGYGDHEELNERQQRLWKYINHRYHSYIASTEVILDEVLSGRRISSKDGSPHDGILFKDIIDPHLESDRGYASLSDVIVIFKPIQGKSATRNNGNYSLTDEEIYHQAIPSSQRFSPDVEQAFTDDLGDKEDSRSIVKAFRDFLHGFKGDFPELATAIAAQPKLMYAREVLRMMNRAADAKTLLAVRELAKSLDSLSAEQLNIFARFMLLNDIHRFKASNPTAKLPLRFTAQSFAEAGRKFTALVNRDTAIKNAVLAERKLQKTINERLASLADELGMPKLADKVRSNNFYILEYARLLKGKGINSDYIQAVVDTRTEQLKDIEHLTALKALSVYNVKDKLEARFGTDWEPHVPKGWKTFNPLQGRFINSAHTLTEKTLGVALELAGQQLGLSQETMKALRSKVSDNSGSHLMVLPEALADTLEKLSVPVQRGPLGKIAKAITTQWKKLMLFFPTRAIKYNIRNITGDLDAVIAGNPQALRYIPQAISELWQAYYGNGEVTPELREFQNRGGAVTIQSTQDIIDDKQFKEYNRLIAELKGKNSSVWAQLPRKIWTLLDKVAWSGIQNFSDFREQWVRYAC